jgi:hypothetical protein
MFLSDEGNEKRIMQLLETSSAEPQSLAVMMPNIVGIDIPTILSHLTWQFIILHFLQFLHRHLHVFVSPVTPLSFDM